VAASGRLGVNDLRTARSTTLIQLESLALYSHDGRRREINFELGRLNVISGVSRTGKTELIKIIDYCAGRKTPSLAPGPLTRRVSWFAAVFVGSDGRRVMTARPQPSGRSSTRAMVEFGSSLVEPGQILVNATNATVRGALDDALGLGRFDVEEYTGARERLRASVSHAIQFCLQSQNELMSPNYLFHRGDDPEVAKDFRTLFPFFVGAVDLDLLVAQRRARELRNQIRHAEERLARIQTARPGVREREQALARRAADAGLISVAEAVVSPHDALRVALDSDRRVSDTYPTEATPSIGELRRAVETARTVVRGLDEERAALGRIDADRGDHGVHLHTQVGRLGIIAAVPSDSMIRHDICPLCGSPVEDPDPTVSELAADAAQLAAQLEALASAGRDIAPAERILDARLEEATAELERHRQALEEALHANQAARNFALISEQRAHIRGAIEEYLRSAGGETELAEREVSERIARLREELDAIEPETRADAINADTDARLVAMGEDMTGWARTLELEASEEGVVAIDRRSLNVAIRTPRGLIGLDEMGSGSNHVGYHVVSHLALHRHFIQQDRPVPRFIFFDQPSLPYFPRELRSLDDGASDVDWDAVKRTFLLVDEVVRSLKGALQVIVTDHAMFAGEEWFNEALVEDWHDGTKLVPDDWPEV
jgi:hypothetical protein